MSIKSIHTEHAPAAIGPYSQAYTAGEFLFTSGQGGTCKLFWRRQERTFPAW